MRRKTGHRWDSGGVGAPSGGMFAEMRNIEGQPLGDHGQMVVATSPLVNGAITFLCTCNGRREKPVMQTAGRADIPEADFARYRPKVEPAMPWTEIKWVIFGWLALINLITFVAVWNDKRRAERGKWRIQEKTLWNFGFLGGVIGLIYGMRKFRHKTAKSSFLGMTVLIFLVNLAYWYLIISYVMWW